MDDRGILYLVQRREREREIEREEEKCEYCR